MPHREIDELSWSRPAPEFDTAIGAAAPVRGAQPLIGILKRTILRIPHLDLFLAPWGKPVDFSSMRGREGELSAIAGWGFKPTAERARAEAARRSLPYLAIEDGFLRSINLGV